MWIGMLFLDQIAIINLRGGGGCDDFNSHIIKLNDIH